MRMGALTELGIRKLNAAQRQRLEVWDDKVPGFGVRISGRSRTFVLMVRSGGRKRRITLGRFPSMTLADARAKAMQIAGGGGENEQSNESGRAAWNFDAVVEDFIRKHCERYNRARTAEETSRLLRSRFVAAWGARDLRGIGRQDVVAILDRDVDAGHGSAANHSLAAVRKLFNWCIGRGLLQINPAVGVERPAPLVVRDRVLSDEELCSTWSAADSMNSPFGKVIKLLILTAQRRGEVAGMRWSEIDLETNLWHLPRERTKNKRAHTVALSEPAIGVLRSIPRMGGDLVFPARGRDDEVMSGFSKMKPKLEDAAQVTGWAIHDLRRTAATGMAGLGVAPHVIERVLNHASGTFAGVAGVYNHFEYLPEMRSALELWGRHVSALPVRFNRAP